MDTNRRGMIKPVLAESLRELMIKNSFEKITIKKICDQAGVIRATFYNHFEDKYDCLNYIVYQDLVESVKEIDVRDSKLIFSTMIDMIMENKEFYQTAYKITGQDSFEDMIRQNLSIYFRGLLDRYRKKGYMERYTNSLLAKYYAECVAFDIRVFVMNRDPLLTKQDMVKMIIELMSVPVTNYFEIDRKNPD